MQLKRGNAPQTVDREIDVEITREEVITILSSFVKRKMAVDNVIPKVQFDDLSIIAVKGDDGEMKLTGITLLGIETLPLQYPEGHAPVKVVFSGQPIVRVPEIVDSSTTLPPALQSIVEAAQKQADEVKK